MTRGKCSEHARQAEQRRGSASERGYDRTWQRFRLHFVGLLAASGILPVCGASLPTGPNTKVWSDCAKKGLANGNDLHVDHEPPLTDDERARAQAGDRSAIDDVNRVGLLCGSCHDAKTKEQSGRRETDGHRGDSKCLAESLQ